jgi:hypothetical protein
MDTENLIAHGRARFEHEAAKRLLKEKYQGKLTFAYRGGMWSAGPELQCNIFTCGQVGEAVLLDLYENPVKVNTTELMTMSQQRWQEQMNAWLVEYEQLSKNR